MKKVVILGMIALLGLTGCSAKSYNNIYDETLSSKDKTDLETVINQFVDGLSVRYTLDDSVAQQTSELFSAPSSYTSMFNAYKTKKQESMGPGYDSANLYIDEFIKGHKDYYEEAKQFGLTHGMLYTSGKQTGFEPVMQEIEPLQEGEMLESLALEETEESMDIELEETTEAETENKYEGEMTDDEYREYLDELFGQEPEYAVLTQEMIDEDVASYTTKEELVTYCYSKLLDSMYGEWGDYQPTDEEVAISFICYYGYDTEGNGIISEEEWDKFNFEEAKEQMSKTLLFAYDEYNASLLANYEYMSSDEFKQQFIDSRTQARQEKESREAEESEAQEVDEYEAWRISNKDIIEMVQTTDFEEPVFSEVVEKDATGYYIPWEKIYALADSEGRLTEYLEFMAYGQTVNINMPEAPLSYYKDKKISLKSWNLVEDSTGSEFIELVLGVPDKLDYVTINIEKTDDNKLVYNTDIDMYLFD